MKHTKKLKTLIYNVSTNFVLKTAKFYTPLVVILDYSVKSKIKAMREHIRSLHMMHKHHKNEQRTLVRDVTSCHVVLA